MGFVQGVNRGQIRMLALEDMVAEKAMVRVIDRFVEAVDFEELGCQGDGSLDTHVFNTIPLFIPVSLAI